MTTHAAALAAMSRVPVTKVELNLDFCTLSFGIAPCIATGTPCYNTIATCKSRTNYARGTRTYKFTSAAAPLPFSAGERPYLTSIKYLPCEIKDNLTLNARETYEFCDEPDTDVGIDPYVAQRSSVQGTYWKKLIARNPNYTGRQARRYEGFIGVPEEEYEQKWVGRIDSITLGKGTVKIEVVDLLKSLDKVEVPPKLDIKLVSNIDASVTSMTLTTVEGLDSSGYVRIGDEIISYVSINPGQNALQSCTRGYFGTVAATHKAKDKIQKVRYYASANPFDLLKDMLFTDAEVGEDYVNSAAYDANRDWPGGEINFSAIVSEPTKLNKLYFEIVDLLDCKSWVGEDLKITIARNLPNDPDRVYHTLSDDQNFLAGSGGTDLNEESRLSRLLLFWDKTTLGKVDDVNAYARLDISIDADAESGNEYNEVKEKKFYCRWIQSGGIQEEVLAEYISSSMARQLFRQRDARPLIQVDVELKDSGLKTGEFVRVDTDELLNFDGSPIGGQGFQIVKRDFKGHKVQLKLLALPPERLGFIAPDSAPDFDNATDADKEYCYITNDDGLIDNRPGYYIY